MLVQDTAKLSDRRQIINTLYISANSVLLGGIALLVEQSSLKNGALLLPVLLVAIAGTPLCLDWRRLILNYKALLDLRFKMLVRLEAMPDFTGAIKTYTEEGEKLYNRKTDGGQSVLFGFSRIEVNIPIVFICLYLFTIAGIIALGIIDFPSIITQLHSAGILPR
ncbi:MAG: hypothetical protein ACHQ4H_13345 [Ktedonobacterales bacterium]